MRKGERLQEMISRSRFKNVNRISKEVDVPYTTIKSFIERDLEKASVDSIVKIAKALNVTVEEIIGDRPPENWQKANPKTIPVPILGVIACGDPITAEENVRGYRNESPDNLPSGNIYYVEAKGDSMEPTIPDGSHVLIREQPDVEYGQIAAVLVNDETEVTLKRVKKQGDLVMLVPDNSDHEPYIITKNNPAKILGKAVRYTQDL